MTELDSVSWRNFLSYGDYTTTLPLSNLGPCLITGEIVGNQGDVATGYDISRDSDRSNGAGKSTPPNVILWVLFGRTMHSAAPGAHVSNWFTKGVCWGELKYKNGDIITRAITPEGRTELMWVRDGNESKVVADTIATTKLQQQRLNRDFGLDWDLFCGSTFFTQYNRPWMEMTDQIRKQAMERAIHVDRFTTYGQVAGEKVTKLDQERGLRRSRLSGVDADVARVSDELIGYRESMDGFEEDRKRRSSDALRRTDEAILLRDTIELPDLVAVQGRWDLVVKVRIKADELHEHALSFKEVAEGHRRDRDSYSRQAEDISAKIKKWEAKEGKNCNLCEQSVSHHHVAGKTEPLHSELAEWVAKAARSEEQRLAVTEEADAKIAEATEIKTRLEKKLPKLTLQEAKFAHRQWSEHNQAAERNRKEADKISVETNPHGATIIRAEAKLAKFKAEQEKLIREVDEYTSIWKHYSYLQKAYSDRRKIKSLAIAKHIPYVNARLSYYLDVLQSDLKIQFTNSLGIESSKWGYTYYCGGERKRTDLAIMFAMFDLHEKMYGRQSNVMVLDEVDGRLDGSGIEALIQIIKNDLASKVETVLIISHKNNMHDVFPRQIHVKRDGRYSQLAEVR